MIDHRSISAPVLSRQTQSALVEPLSIIKIIHNTFAGFLNAFEYFGGSKVNNNGLWGDLDIFASLEYHKHEDTLVSRRYLLKLLGFLRKNLSTELMGSPVFQIIVKNGLVGPAQPQEPFLS